MKKVNSIFAALALLFTAHTASAQAPAERLQAPLWNCALTFDVEGGGLRLFVGHFQLEGTGEIACTDVVGNQENIPVYVRIGAAPVALSIGVGQLRIAGLATGIGLAGQPSDLLGNYLVGSIRGALAIGAGADMALHAADRALTVNAAVQVVSGVGLNLGFDHMTIEPL